MSAMSALKETMQTKEAKNIHWNINKPYYVISSEMQPNLTLESGE
jgi:hypothetical protein